MLLQSFITALKRHTVCNDQTRGSFQTENGLNGHCLFTHIIVQLKITILYRAEENPRHVKYTPHVRASLAITTYGL